MERMEDSPSYRLGVALGLLRGMLEAPEWSRQHAEEFLKEENARLTAASGAVRVEE